MLNLKTIRILVTPPAHHPRSPAILQYFRRAILLLPGRSHRRTALPGHRTPHPGRKRRGLGCHRNTHPTRPSSRPRPAARASRRTTTRRGLIQQKSGPRPRRAAF